MRLRRGDDESSIDLLEVIPDADHDDAPLPPPAPFRHTRLVVAIAAALLLVGLIAFPVRTKVDAARLRSLETTWIAARGIADERAAIATDLRRRAATSDDVEVSSAARALDTEAASAINKRAKGIKGMLLFDTGTRQTRDAMVNWMHSEAYDRSLHRAEPSEITILARANVDHLLAAEHRRLKVKPLSVLHAPPPLHSADTVTASLHRYLDQPTGTRLLATDSVQIQNIDIDASTISGPLTSFSGGATALSGYSNPMIPRSGYVAFVGNEGVERVPLSGQARQTFLGQGTWAFAALNPADVWLLQSDGVREVDADGTVVRGPFLLATRPIAEVTGGLLTLTQRGDTIAVVDPATGQIVRTVATQAEYLASSATHVAWIAFDGPDRNTRVHVRSLIDGGEATFDDISDQYTVTAAFSPDGRRLATVANTSVGPPQEVALRIFDVTTGSSTPVRGDAGKSAIKAVVWTPAGDRLFVASDDAFPLSTWAVGDEQLSTLRISGIHVEGLVALPNHS